MAESIVAARASFVLFNPVSTIRHLIVRIREIEHRPLTAVRLVQFDDVIDACSCASADAMNAVNTRNVNWFCSRPGAFLRLHIPRGVGQSDFFPHANCTISRSSWVTCEGCNTRKRDGAIDCSMADSVGSTNRTLTGKA